MPRILVINNKFLLKFLPSKRLISLFINCVIYRFSKPPFYESNSHMMNDREFIILNILLKIKLNLDA